MAKVTPSDLIASNMRMKPDRVLLAELRGGEAFDFLKLLTTGHSGSITHITRNPVPWQWNGMCSWRRSTTRPPFTMLRR